jgi:hypothetical protein
VAQSCGGTIIGFADPLYILCEHMTGLTPEHKDVVPFCREFLQTVGQWGRGHVDADQYRHTFERALFQAWVKSGEARKLLPWVNWDLWGTDEIWTDALQRRSDELPSRRIFLTNVRFKHEFEWANKHGWDHWHVLCSRQTYEERLQAVGMTLADKRISDVSESLAGALDSHVVGIIKSQPTGPKLKVIWNDARTSPSDRFLTLEEFKKYAENQEIEPEYDYTAQQSADTARTPDTTAAIDDGAGLGPVAKRDPTDGSPKSENRDPWERRRARAAEKGLG